MIYIRHLTRLLILLFVAIFGLASAFAEQSDWRNIQFPTYAHEIAIEALDIANTARAPPLESQNVAVADFHTYFVRGAHNDNAEAVWVHNNCPNATNKVADWTKHLKDNATVTTRSGSTDPSNIRFTQNSIKSYFKDEKGLDDLVTGLRNGTVKPSDVPPIRVFETNGQLFSLDNRRLHAFQQAGVPIRFKPATAGQIKKESSKFTTDNGGTSIVVRGQ